MNRPTFHYGEDHLTASLALGIVRGQVEGILGDAAKSQVQASADIVADIVQKEEVVYGINTGFGPLCNTMISKENTRKLQYNILRSHATGVGEMITPELSKLMLVLKTHALSRGKSGISLAALERIIWHIDHDVIPCVPEQGSVGASGDLAPLAHLFLPLIGLGHLWLNGQCVPAGDALAKLGVEGIDLGPKEGLALINGTQFIAAHAVLVVEKLHNCLNHADLIGAMMIEALLGSQKPFRPELHRLRPYPAVQHVAHRVYHLLDDSEILRSHLHCNKVQDPYSLRCIPQVHGASRTAWLHLKDLLEVELNAVTDNPVIISRNLTISGGNFHGQPLALPLDYTTLASAEIGNISDRRVYLALEGHADGLPKLLMKDTGINSGFMLCQYTTAALVSENKSLTFPPSADSIPTSLGQEDHVSMGSISGRRTLQVIGNLEKILAIELLCAAQAFDFRHPLKSGEILERCHSHIRSTIDHADEDRVFSDDIAKALLMIRQKELTQIIKQAENDFTHFKTPHHDLFEVY